jgi:hypothetical protein
MGGISKMALFSVLAATLIAACAEIDPETGPIRSACAAGDSNPSVSVDFKTQIRPLIDNLDPSTRGCIGCHAETSGSMEGFIATGLDLTKLQLIRRGDRGTTNIVVPGQPCESLIVQKLQGTSPSGARMPRGGPFWADDKIQLMIDWIAEGANGADE